jgi:hypothetical protein
MDVDDSALRDQELQTALLADDDVVYVNPDEMSLKHLPVTDRDQNTFVFEFFVEYGGTFSPDLGGF